MSRTSKTTWPRPESLPDVDEALRKLGRGHVRAAVSLGVRLLSVAFLIALLSVQLPAVRRALPLVNALGIALIAWPFFTSIGRLYSWRIALGRRYAEAARWVDAERVLAPLGGGVGAPLFDATGEGRYHLALARHGLGREADARTLWSELATQYANREWGIKAAESLRESGTPAPPGA
jgi:hypothetical protein